MKQLLAILILCTGATAADGPMLSLYPVAQYTDPKPERQKGHTAQWQLDRIAEGLPLEPAIYVHGMKFLDNELRLKWLERDAELYAQFDGGPLVLRVGDLTESMENFDDRFPLTEDNWRQSWRCVRVHPLTGAYDDEQRPDPFSGLTDKWYDIGARWANTAWMVAVQKIIPNPTVLVMRENNEGGRVKWDHLVNGGGEWQDESTVRNISIRAWEWVACKQATGGEPAEFRAEFEQLERELYQALYRGFDDNLSVGWRGKLRTVGYGGPNENHQNDASSSNLYMGMNKRPAELTSPYHIEEWKQRRRDNWDTLGPRGWAELSVRMRGPTMVMPALAGLHDVVDPESFAAYMTFGLWVMQSPGRDVRLAWYESQNTRPDELIIGEVKSWSEAAIKLGRPDLLELTVEDYEIALLKRMQQIHEHPVINRYWREGVTAILDSPQNDEKAHRVYATETTIPGVRQTLLFVYTPCEPVGEFQVGEYTVPAKRAGYYVTGGVQEVATEKQDSRQSLVVPVDNHFVNLPPRRFGFAALEVTPQCRCLEVVMPRHFGRFGIDLAWAEHSAHQYAMRAPIEQTASARPFQPEIRRDVPSGDKDENS